MAEEVLSEVEAVQAVYGDDCLVLDKYPPHLHVHIKPRTADVSSQQFVEAVIGIRAGSKYPDEPPHISIIDSKGLDEQRQKHLVTGIHNRACELSSYAMLVALCEEAVERLSSMNHPDGNCPLCLYSLVEEDADNKLPFMKLMSCFHCFHCECIIRWWNWLQTLKETDATNISGGTLPVSGEKENEKGMHGMTQESVGTCPVCRKVFHAKDIDHVLALVGTHSQLRLEESDVSDDKRLLQSDSENIRRLKFEATLKLQQENSGLIEPKKSEVLLPGMFLPRPITPPSTVSDKEITEQQHADQAINAETSSGGPPDRPSSSKHKYTGMRKHRVRNSNSDQAVKSQTNSSDPSQRLSGSEHEHRYSGMRKHQGRNSISDQPPDSQANSGDSSHKLSSSDYRYSGMRKHQGRNSREQVKQWIRKENDTTN